MMTIAPITLEGHGVRLEPLTTHHLDDLRAASEPAFNPDGPPRLGRDHFGGGWQPKQPKPFWVDGS